MIKVIELFSGIGAFRKALERLNIEHEVVGISEIDKYAIKSYNAIYGDTYNFGDISKIDKLPYCDLLTYGFPCQDISVAGLQKGIAKGTRSGLLHEVQRLLQEYKNNNELPKYLIMENVKNLVGKKFKPKFDEYLEWLNNLGYNNYWQVLNAKDYEIPQNRERVFCISIRKDINKSFNFPLKQELKLRLKDMLEDEVDKKYYLPEDKISSLKHLLHPQKIAKTIRTTGHGSIDKHCFDVLIEPKIQQVGNIVQEKNFKNPQRGRVYSADGISPTLTTIQGGGLGPKTIELPVIVASRGRNPENPSSRKAGEYVEQRLEINKKGVTNTLTTVQKDNYLLTHDFKIRKLTPKECWRLMGFDDEDIDKCMDNGLSNTQLYKQAGNSIVVNVLEKIFEELL